MVQIRSAFEILTGKHTPMRPLGRLGRRTKSNIRVDLKEIGLNVKIWIYSAHDMDYW